ncbi:MAG: High-affinity zinc uptake system membrane protein ZnuB [Candidatus Anoxychlamydiales bacterium]|nr:High-affinity zinc uptake system membrane protein ZnuB [Candidatus Anoxychlamydiales bacterium]
MIEFLSSLKSSYVFHLAILAGIITSFTSGIMGSYVVVKKISSITGSISHSILGGIGFFIFLNYHFNTNIFSPLQGGILAALISAFFIGFIHLKYKQKEDAVIASIWSFGMALGIIFLTLVPNQEATCTHYLFGDIFSITPKDILFLSILAFVIIFITIYYYKKFLLICFDEEAAYLQKIKVKSLYFLLLSMISISIVLMVQTVGIILVIALLTIPATIANSFKHKLSHVMILAIILSIIFNIIGITISFVFSYPPGATIAITTTIFYVISLIVKKNI